MFDNKVNSSSGPEDIFGKTAPVTPNSAANAAPSSSPAPSIPVAPSPVENTEPAIKNTPSNFNPKNFAAVPAAPSQINKNIIFLGALVVVAIGGLVFGAWWFFFRSKSAAPAEITNPDVKNLYETTVNADGQQPSADKNNIVDNLSNNNNAPVNINDKPSAPLDSDGDGLTDEEELRINTNLANPDSDGDGLFDREEVYVYKTNPLMFDTDDDGLSDKEEVTGQTNPLVADSMADNHVYHSAVGKFSFRPLDGLVKETEQSDFVQFNDNVNQIKFYVYINPDNLDQFFPDILYTINEDNDGELIIAAEQNNEDKTPFSTEYNTQFYRSANGNVYLVRYVATKRSDSHHNNFSDMLLSFKFLP